MRTTRRYRLPLDPLSPWGVLCFLALAALWAVWGYLPERGTTGWRAACRLAGYAALAAMLVPYLHIVQRAFRSRPGRMSAWLRLHVACSYAAFALLLLHSHGRASSPLTRALVWLTWAVMLSGVVGFYGQKLLYALLPAMKDVPREFGFERLGPEREALLEAGRARAKSAALANAPDVVREFVDWVIAAHLDRPFRLRWRRGDAGEGLEAETDRYAHARLLADDGQREALDEVWRLAEARRRLDREYRLHRLGRLWLLVHGPASWALLVLLVEHVAVSLWYGGF